MALLGILRLCRTGGVSLMWQWHGMVACVARCPVHCHEPAAVRAGHTRRKFQHHEVVEREQLGDHGLRKEIALTIAGSTIE